MTKLPFTFIPFAILSLLLSFSISADETMEEVIVMGKPIKASQQSAIEAKQTVVIWPSNIQQKDINDMVLAGHDVQNLVESNTYRGLEATLKFNTWKRT